MRLVQTTGRYFYDFSNWNSIDTSIYGSDKPNATLKDNGVILGGNTSDCSMRINDIIPIKNATINVDLTVSSSTQIGFTYRSSVLSNKNGSFAFLINISATSIAVCKGADSDNTYSPYTYKTVSGSYIGRHTLSVVVSGTSHKVYLDGTLIASVTETNSNNFGYIMLRTAGNMVNERFHSLEVLSSEISDPSIFNIARRIAIVFDKDVNCTNLLDNISAFTVTSVSKQFIISGDTVTKTSAPVDIAYGKDASGSITKNVLILTVSKVNAFCVPISINIKYNSLLGNLYGERTIDVLPSFSYDARIVSTNLQPPGFDVYDASINLTQNTFGNKINSRVIQYVNAFPNETLAFLGTKTGGIAIVLNGIIKP
jgi:hypothetical protein